MQPPAARAALLALATLALPLAAPAASAEATLGVLDTTLPTSGHGLAAVWTGTHAYLFGGGTQATIQRFDPATRTLETMAATLPTGRNDVAAAWDGRHAYLVGGFGIAGATTAALPDVLRYDPQADRVEALPPLPEGRAGAVALWRGGLLHVVGGCEPQAEPTPCPTLRAQPGQAWRPFGDAIRVGAEPSQDMAAAEGPDGLLYLFGGRTVQEFQRSSEPSDRIRSYDPLSGRIGLLDVRLPAPRTHAAAVADGGTLHVVGGFQAGTHETTSVWDFDADAWTATQHPHRLPFGSAAMAAVWADTGYVFAGSHGGRGLDNRAIYCFACVVEEPAPAEPDPGWTQGPPTPPTPPRTSAPPRSSSASSPPAVPGDGTCWVEREGVRSPCALADPDSVGAGGSGAGLEPAASPAGLPAALAALAAVARLRRRREA